MIAYVPVTPAITFTLSADIDAFEKYLMEHEIRQILGRVHHPDEGEDREILQNHGGDGDGFKSMDEFIIWCNMKRPHISLIPTEDPR